jgi:predicted dehydrogenase
MVALGHTLWLFWPSTISALSLASSASATEPHSTSRIPGNKQYLSFIGIVLFKCQYHIANSETCIMTCSRRTFLKSTALAGSAFIIVPRHVLGKGHVPPSDRINIGFIGLGKQSRGLARRFTEMTDAQIVAGSDVWTSKMEWFRHHVEAVYATHRGTSGYNGVASYPDYEELLERSDIDAVVIATPDHWHALQAVAAMEAGKDVFCEKPLTHTIGEGIRMVKAAKATGRIVQTGSMQRSWEDFRKACELVRNGYIGDVKKIIVNAGDPARDYDLPAEPMPAGVDWDRWCGPAPLLDYNHRLAPSSNDVDFWPDWRLYKEVGGGIICDWGAHMFDIAQWGLGMDRSGPVEFVPPEDPAAVRGLRMKYANGVKMIHEDFGRGWAVRFIGSDGSIDISRKFFESTPANLVDVKLKADDVRLYDAGGNFYKDWLDAIRIRTQPVCDVETGHRSATVGNIANIAYWLNRPLKWDPGNESFIDDAEANALTRAFGRDNFAFKEDTT